MFTALSAPVFHLDRQGRAIYITYTCNDTALMWQGTGFQMVILLTGLQAIPSELSEAAAMDSAGPWQRFWHVTL
jgi:ABC-type sugar transport system permease subunit